MSEDASGRLREVSVISVLALLVVSSVGVVGLVAASSHFELDYNDHGSTNSPVVAGEQLWVEYYVENHGDSVRTQNISVGVVGEPHSETNTVTLSSGSHSYETFTWDTEPGDAGEHTVRLRKTSPSGIVSGTSVFVDVLAPASFAVPSASAESGVVAGDSLAVSATVNNTGDVNGTTSVELRHSNGTVLDTVNTGTLEPGTPTDVALTWDTTPADYGETDLVVDTGDENRTVTATLDRLGTFEVGTVDANVSSLLAGEGLEVTATVENVGDQSSARNVSLVLDGETLATMNVPIANDTSTQVTLAGTVPGDTAGGTYDAIVDATDHQNATEVDVNRLPTADATVDGNATVGVGESVALNGSGSSDDGTIDTYEWDVDGDGNFEVSGETPAHSYGAPGAYTVTLRVSDDDGATDTATVGVTVTDTTDPTADAGANRTVDRGTSVGFDGANSTDNGQIATYEWDFGDGTNATGATPTHTFTQTGTYLVELAVTDGVGNTDTDAATITVQDGTDPTADASNSPTTADEGSPISFDGTASSDDVGVTSYEWDWTSDGSYDDTGPTPNHTYASPGTYTVTLRVTDDAGNSDTTTLSVTVRSLGGGGGGSGESSVATPTPSTATGTPTQTATEAAEVTATGASTSDGTPDGTATVSVGTTDGADGDDPPVERGGGSLPTVAIVVAVALVGAAGAGLVWRRRG